MPRRQTARPMTNLPAPLSAPGPAAPSAWTARHGLVATALPLGALILAAGTVAPADHAPACTALAIFAIVVGLAGGGLARSEAGGAASRRFGTANVVTLFRGAGAAVLGAAALAGRSAPEGAFAWALAAGTAALVALDGVDGWLARRDGLASAFGARFDMEIDALTGLVLALLAWQFGKAGPWVLGIGLMRYGFVLLGCLLPRFARPLPPSRRRKAVCVLTLGALVLIVAPPVAPPASVALAAAALALLAWSFACDLRWLARA